MVWTGTVHDGGADREVFMWTPSEGIVRPTINAYYDGAPQVSDDRVAWDAWLPGDLLEIFAWYSGMEVAEVFTAVAVP